RFQIGWYWVILDFAIELVAQDDHVLAIPWKHLLIGVSGIPDPGFAHEIEAGALNNGGVFALSITAKEDGGPEDPLEGSDQAAVLCTTLLHGERVQHLRGA